MEAEQFKCARCKHDFPAEGFGLNRKQERSKSCKTCNEQKQKWAKKKREFRGETNLDLEYWKEHPIYKGYWASKSGSIYNMKMRKTIGAFLFNGYIQLALRVPQTRMVYAYRFVWEAFNGVIPDGKVINHLNEIKDDNRIDNLEVVSASENSTKSSKMQELNKQGRRKPKACIAHKEGDDTDITYASISEAGRKTGCGTSSVQKVCDGINNTTTSKTDNSKWSFKYAQ